MRKRSLRILFLLLLVVILISGYFWVNQHIPYAEIVITTGCQTKFCEYSIIPLFAYTSGSLERDKFILFQETPKFTWNIYTPLGNGNLGSSFTTDGRDYGFCGAILFVGPGIGYGSESDFYKYSFQKKHVVLFDKRSECDRFFR